MKPKILENLSKKFYLEAINDDGEFIYQNEKEKENIMN